MSSYNDFASLTKYGSQPMFSQGQGIGPDVNDINPFFASQPATSAMAAFDKPLIDMPSALNGAGGGGGVLDSLTGWGKDFFGTKEAPGWGGTALGVAQGLFGGWLGMQQYGLAKEKLAESKRQFQLNYDAQKNLTNSQLEDRQRARVASNPGAYQSVGTYMNQYGVK
jgi:hypothetical protein